VARLFLVPRQRFEEGQINPYRMILATEIILVSPKSRTSVLRWKWGEEITPEVHADVAGRQAWSKVWERSFLEGAKREEPKPEGPKALCAPGVEPPSLGFANDERLRFIAYENATSRKRREDYACGVR